MQTVESAENVHSQNLRKQDQYRFEQVFRLLSLFVRRELKIKYRGTVLGYLWSMLNPLLFMLVISAVFSQFVKDVEHYPLFVLGGILGWNTMAMSIQTATHSIAANTSLIKKIRVPLWIFPQVPLGSAAVNFLLALLPFIGICLYLKAQLTAQILWMPLILLLFMVFLSGVFLTLSVYNVYFRDIAHVLDPLLSLAFYATPIIYDRNSPMIPDYIRGWLAFNPLTYYIETLRYTLYDQGVQVALWDISLLFGLSAASLAVGILVYYQHRKRLVYYL